jgi:hypothetical protein
MESRLRPKKNGKKTEFDLTNAESVVNYNPVALEMLESGSGGALEKIEKFLEFDLTNGESMLYFILMLRLIRKG